MRTLKMALALALCAACAMNKYTEYDSRVVSQTKPQRITTSGPHFYQEHSINGAILRVKVMRHSRCVTKSATTWQRIRIDMEGPDKLYCDVNWGGFEKFLTVAAGAGTAYSIYKAGSEESEGWTLLTIPLGGVFLGFAGIGIYCTQDETVTKTNLGVEEQEDTTGEYNCEWQDLAGTDVGIMLASGTIMRANTNHKGTAYFDLAGAEPQDIENIMLYVSEYEIAEPLVLSDREKELLAFALTPKQGDKLPPIYGELKTKAREAAIKCYDQTFADNAPGGTVTVSIEVAPQGRVRKLSANFFPGYLSEANSCIWDSLSGLKFDPWEGEALAVDVPVSFKFDDAEDKSIRMSFAQEFAKERGGHWSEYLKEADEYLVRQRAEEKRLAEERLAEERLAREERLAEKRLAIEERLARVASPASTPPPEPAQKVEKILVGGVPVTVVHDPSLGCTAGVADHTQFMVSIRIRGHGRVSHLSLPPPLHLPLGQGEKLNCFPSFPRRG